MDEDRAHWGMLALAWMLYFSFGAVSSSLSPLVTPILDELHLSYSQFGLVLGTWQLVYVGTAIPLGMIIDRIGTKRSLLLGALLVSASGFARSLAVNFPTLLAAVAIFGFGGPIISIGLPKLIAEWFTGRSRGWASGIYVSGSSMGSVAALALTNGVVLPLVGSWRHAIQVYASIGLLVAIAWLILGRQPEGPRHATTRRGVTGSSMRVVIGQAAVIPVVIIGFAGFFSNHGMQNWLPKIFEVKGLSPAAAGLLAAIPNLLGVIGSIVVVRMAGVHNRRLIAVALLLTTGSAILTIAFARGPLMVAAVVVFGFCSGSIMPFLLNTFMEMPEVGSRYMGAAAGLFFSVGEIGGFSGPAMMGFMTDLTGSFVGGMMILAAAMALMLIPTSRLRSARPEPTIAEHSGAATRVR
jgi:cyanate permease